MLDRHTPPPEAINTPNSEIRSSDHHSGNAKQQPKNFPPAKLLVLLILLMFSLWRIVADWEVWFSVWQSDTVVTGQSVSDSAEVDNRSSSGGTIDLSNPILPLSEIRSGGPPKDGIPALTNPKLLEVDKAQYLKPEDRVIGVVTRKTARAYPLKILNHHEIVNDQIEDALIAVTYCPLCDSVAVFDRNTPLGVRDFGVSGLLYNSNVLLYDRGGRPEGLWSQMKSSGVTGPGSGKLLKTLPLELTTWGSWAKRHPDTKVLSAQTDYQRDYNHNPYAAYLLGPELMFPVQPESNQLPAKSRVLGLWTEKSSRAYPQSAFDGKVNRVEEKIDGKRVVIEFDAVDSTLRVSEADEGVQWMYSFWFAWYAFHPESTIVKLTVAD